MVKFLIIFMSLIAFNALAQEFSQSQLQSFVGYKSLSQHPNINRKQLDFLSYYTDRNGPWFAEFNHYLRTRVWHGWGSEELENYAFEMDDLMATTPLLPKDIVLFRGQSMQWLGRHFSIGEEFEDSAYYSTSSSIEVARSYSGHTDLSFIMILYFGNDDDARGLVLNNYDREVLLKRGLKFKVMDSAKSTLKRYGIVQVCSESGCEDKIKSKKIKKWWKAFKNERLGVNSH